MRQKPSIKDNTTLFLTTDNTTPSDFPIQNSSYINSEGYFCPFLSATAHPFGDRVQEVIDGAEVAIAFLY